MNKSESKYFNTALRMNEALLALLEEKALEYITVKEICHQAGVNRSTFYLHYETISDLVHETLEMINQRFRPRIPSSLPPLHPGQQKSLLGSLSEPRQYAGPYTIWGPEAAYPRPHSGAI